MKHQNMHWHIVLNINQYGINTSIEYSNVMMEWYMEYYTQQTVSIETNIGWSDKWDYEEPCELYCIWYTIHQQIYTIKWYYYNISTNYIFNQFNQPILNYHMYIFNSYFITLYIILHYQYHSYTLSLYIYLYIISIDCQSFIKLNLVYYSQPVIPIKSTVKSGCYD